MSIRLQDESCMRLALREAKKGWGKTSPNPCVGAVVVRNGKIVGKGYHIKAGTPHAEVHALRRAGRLAAGATLYVTLEPCNHTGRTPPCTEAILRSGISRVVVGMDDPNPNVAGGGGAYLESRGLTVTRGVLRDECTAMNRVFGKYITTGLPWVVMKAGVSLDGRIAAAMGQSGWITNEQSRRHAHSLRDWVDAILVGIGTVLTDDPSLTTRLPSRKGKDPLRVIIDTNLRLPVSARVLAQESDAETWIYSRPDASPKRRLALERAGARVLYAATDGAGRLILAEVLHSLGRAGITSVLVEGGGMIHGSLLRAKMVDEVYYYIAPIFLGGNGVPVIDRLGASAPFEEIRLQRVSRRRIGDNTLISGLFPWSGGGRKPAAAS